jgi:hypothetical protein
MRRAVAQSLLNVLSVHRQSGTLDLPALFARVWEYTPQPTEEGVALIKKRVDIGTDPAETSVVDTVAALITENREEILRQLVGRGILKKT